MINVALCSDIHLNFLTLDRVTKFAETLFKAGPDAVLITGDISEGDVLVQHLKILLAVVDKDIYVVLGNHDYWKSSFDKVATAMRDLMKENPRFHWLPETGVVELTDKTALVGVDGWYDAGYGDWKRGGIFMNDWQHIEEFSVGFVPGMYGNQGMTVSKDALISVCRQKANRDAALAEQLLQEAFIKRDHVVFATHVPPWPEVARYRGRATDEFALPYYTSKAMGVVLEDVAKYLKAGQTLTVFCGHTHDKAFHRFSANLSVHCSPAQYGSPAISSMVGVL